MIVFSLYFSNFVYLQFYLFNLIHSTYFRIELNVAFFKSPLHYFSIFLSYLLFISILFLLIFKDCKINDRQLIYYFLNFYFIFKFEFLGSCLNFILNFKGSFQEKIVSLVYPYQNLYYPLKLNDFIQNSNQVNRFCTIQDLPSFLVYLGSFLLFLYFY